MTLTENMAIARYFEGIFPDKPLLGGSPSERAEIVMLNAI